MTARARKAILLSGGVFALIIVALGVYLMLPANPPPSRTAAASARSGPAPLVDSATEFADKFLAAFQTGDAAVAAGLTDAPDVSRTALAGIRRNLSPRNLSAKRTTPVEPGPNSVDLPIHLTWIFGSDRVWEYDSVLPLVKDGVRWRVHWVPSLVHPKLKPGNGLALVGQTGQAAVVDRDGKPFLVWQGGGTQPADPGIAPLLTAGMTRVAGEQGGKDGWRIVLIDSAGTELERLGGSDAVSKPLTTTLSLATQRAAQGAVDSVGQPAMLIAVQPSTGDILAVAQNAAAGSDPKVLHGLYPPGSTFKIATVTAVLAAGAADVDTVLPCPGEITVGSRTIPNDDHFALGDVPMHTAFARSCNTTFAKLAGGLGPDALSTAAGTLGLNADFVVPGFDTEAGGAKPAASTTQRVEDGIGQGTVQASPFGVVLMSATVASGRAVTPRLWRDLKTEVSAGYQPPPRAVLDKIRTMMREVVTAGTARTLAARGAVFGKTGTAQFGDAQHAHGWFTGYRGDLALAVLVESGESSGPALAIADKFLSTTR
jgi:hypothetical protein